MTAPSSTNGMAEKLRPWLVGFGVGSVAIGFILLWTTPLGWVFVVTGAIELAVGLLVPSLAGRDPDRVRLLVSVGFLMLAALLIRSASIHIDNGQWGAATVGLIGAVAGIFVAALGIVKTYVKRRDGQD